MRIWKARLLALLTVVVVLLAISGPTAMADDDWDDWYDDWYGYCYYCYGYWYPYWNGDDDWYDD